MESDIMIIFSQTTINLYLSMIHNIYIYIHFDRKSLETPAFKTDLFHQLLKLCSLWKALFFRGILKFSPSIVLSSISPIFLRMGYE